ncbi:hypothetical protein BDP27DRAFT_1417213 [Rhodocollybia butyracea]|uniref:Uncharacterized protein n=1 Tax=Rhodocollybia butyracea TaxID=206335 RepID=A0A9P5Q286_9AGAR|nr:hypothetical protein BDP27DRAFT_1417213 [Rhodocollybia butyracea]
MNRKKLNTLAKRNYQPSSGWSSAEDEYEPSQQLSPLPKKARFAEGNDGTPLTPPRPSFLMSLETNKSIANSHVLDDDVGSQQFIENLFASNGLTSTNLHMEECDSDIDNAQYEPQSQKHWQELYDSSVPSSPAKLLPTQYKITADEDSLTVAEVGQVTEEFCPHLATSCLCVDFLLTQYHQLNSKASTSTTRTNPSARQSQITSNISPVQSQLFAQHQPRVSSGLRNWHYDQDRLQTQVNPQNAGLGFSGPLYPSSIWSPSPAEFGHASTGTLVTPNTPFTHSGPEPSNPSNPMLGSQIFMPGAAFLNPGYRVADPSHPAYREPTGSSNVHFSSHSYYNYNNNHT